MGGPGFSEGKGAKRGRDQMANNNGMMGDEKKQQNAAKKEDLENQYNTIANELAPAIAGCIDSYGGVCLLNQVSSYGPVQELVDQIPSGFPKKLKKIIEKYPDFIVQLEEGYVATALAYENGIVSPNGELNKSMIHKKKINGEQGDEEENVAGSKKNNNNNAPANKKQKLGNAPISNNTGLYQQSYRGEAAARELEQAAGALYEAALQSDEQELRQVIERVNECRSKAFYVNAKGFCEFFMKVMLDMGCEAEIPISMNQVANNPDIRSIHNTLTQKERKKMAKLLEDCPENFIVTRGDGENTTVIKVALTHNAVKLNNNNNNNIHPSKAGGFSNKGKGKNRC